MIFTKQNNKPVKQRRDTNPKLLFVVCIISFLSVGIPYWMIPYNHVSLPGALMGPGLIAVIGAAFFVRMKEAVDFWMGASFVGTVVPGVVMARVMVETVSDPTSHNLWPFEVVFAAIVGYCCALSGTIVGMLITKFRGAPVRSRR
jgi:hypothetical protein